MDCRRFHPLLEALAEGRINAAEEAALQAHLQQCERCRAELAFLCGEDEDLPANEETFTLEILAETTGSACSKARESFCADLEGELSAVDSQLLAEHRRHCDACERFHRTLAGLPEILASMASLEPDEDFVADVLAETTARRSLSRNLSLRLAALRRMLLLRPQLAMELAYAGTLALVLLMATPLSPLRDLPGQALAILQGRQTPPAAGEAQSLLTAGVSAVGTKVESLSSQATDGLGADLRIRSGQMSEGFDALENHGRELLHVVRQNELHRVVPILKEVRCDAEILWNGLRKKLDEEGSRDCRDSVSTGEEPADEALGSTPQVEEES